MANISITLEGIHQAAANLNYRPGSIKQKTLAAILSFYTTEDALDSLDHIDTDTLVKTVWDVGAGTAKIISKRRNFFSLRSAINADLKKLSAKDKNPENIIITDANIFDMTEDAKNNLLSSFSNAIKTGDVDLQQATDILKVLSDFLDEFETDEKTDASLNIIEQIKNLLARISREIPPDDTDTPDSEDDTEEIVLEEDEELEEIQDLDEEIIDVDETETEDDLEEDPDLEEEELVALDPDEELVELEHDQALEETEAEDRDSPPGEIDTTDEDAQPDEDTEEIVLEDDEELEEVDEVDGLSEEEFQDPDLTEDGEQPAELDEDEELVEEEELDEDTEEIVLEDDEDLEEVDELTEEEIQALEDFRQKQALAEEFDDTLGEREKKFNAYVKVPGGIYTVGTKKSGPSGLKLQQFDMPEVYIGRYPVTNALFEVFIDKTGYRTTAEKTGFGTVFFSRYKRDGNQASWHKSGGSRQVKGACWYQPHGPGSSLHKKRNHPVVQVSVEDAFAYASWIGRRLPTQAEWEAAARTDMGCRYPWGNDFALQALNIEDTGLADTCQVDAYDMHANAFTIADMLGNVMEWTSDEEMPPAAAPDVRPMCVAKGGAWNSGPGITISSRGLYKNGFTANTIGFRCISELFL
ncbi:MAG: SUMF1/EgtB/PvdO family nonheme iron enzyme [Desulfotignum sp.]